jgi:alpha-methylacyl-CoA racemase
MAAQGESSGPLVGLKVVELAGLGPGPFCAMMLADLGADVLRIDRPGPSTADPTAELLNRGRRSVVLDLKTAGGSETLRQLIDRADVLLEGFRPGVTERLGFGPDICLERNPGLVYARMTGWGQDGPLALAAGHDIGYIARTGALHGFGRPDGPPQFPANLLGDFGGGGMLVAFGICAALFERSQSGAGQVIDAAIVDGTASLMAMTWMWTAMGRWRDERGVNFLDGGAPYYNVYETADGKHIAVGAIEPQFFAALLRGLEISEIPDRDEQANWPALRELFAARIKEKTRDEWTEVFTGTDACVEPILTMTEAVVDPHMAARGAYVVRDGRPQPAPSPRFSRTPGALTVPPPLPGQHTLQALADWGIANPQALVDSGAAVQV